MSNAGFWRRLMALCRKETYQILRDPSSVLIAFVLPVVMLFVYSFGINLDSSAIPVGLVLEDTSPEARHLADSFVGSPYLAVSQAHDRKTMEERLMCGKVRGFIVIPSDFAQKLQRLSDTAPILVVTDGSEPNIAFFVENYSRGVWQSWLQERAAFRGMAYTAPISFEYRHWYNPAAESRKFIIPGSITVIMTVIGALLTSMVVAREWERGTMEALLATPVTRTELLFSKILPYYILGMASLFVCVFVAVVLLGVPLRGSIWVLWLTASLFLGAALGFGLLLSTVTRNQFNAAQIAMLGGFLPALMLSGFIYEIRSMPPGIRHLTYLVPARYFVNAMQTIFLAGDVWPVILRNLAFLAAAATFFLGLTALKTRRRLE